MTPNSHTTIWRYSSMPMLPLCSVRSRAEPGANRTTRSRSRSRVCSVDSSFVRNNDLFIFFFLFYFFLNCVSLDSLFFIHLLASLDGTTKECVIISTFKEAGNRNLDDEWHVQLPHGGTTCFSINSEWRVSVSVKREEDFIKYDSSSLDEVAWRVNSIFIICFVRVCYYYY
jgi:hypothetical protein